MTNTVILIFDLAMLFLSANLVGFEGCLIVTFALMSSFGPVVALASLGATLQNTFAAGGRVLDILDECPVVEEIMGKEEVDFHGAEVKNVTFAYGEETILEDFSVTIPENKIIGINGRSRIRQIDIAQTADAILAGAAGSGKSFRQKCGGDQYVESARYGKFCNAGNTFIP